MEEEIETNKVTLFGRDVSRIPCFRSSWLCGISVGIGSGLMYFLFTSKPRISTHVAFGSMVVITGSYWTYCRYDWAQKEHEVEMLKTVLQKKVLVEGTEMEKLHKVADSSEKSNNSE